jgi:hypothetical protein
MGSLYIRNSGTEPKTGIHAKGWMNAKSKWEDLVDRLLFYLFLHIKSPENPMVQIQLKILKLIAEHPRTESEIARVYPEIPLKRMLHEISRYEGLISKRESLWVLTGPGKKWIDQFSKNERSDSI